ncbi:GNAT family N-acetyltransferase [Actinosynnema sp. NPDC053489]|uniref:GNAT family N-acetyltransferase n=1 Tax=Actinosynnema sp. NPDC053489 TaxID=3363916 RepID=UPI0037C929C4
MVPFAEEDVRVVPANEASWAELEAVFGAADAGRCRCRRFTVVGWLWRDSTQEERVAMLREQTACDEPGAPATSGLVAYVGDEPAGWVAVEPRLAYPKLRTLRVPWSGRDEDRDDPGVWAVTCFVVRRGFRGRGLTCHLARAAVDFARDRGASAVEGYPVVEEPGKVVTWGEMNVGARQVFQDAGFTEVGRPTLRRVVMRVDFTAASHAAITANRA